MIKTHVGGFIIRSFKINESFHYRLEVRDDQHNLLYYGKKFIAPNAISAGKIHLIYCKNFAKMPFMSGESIHNHYYNLVMGPHDIF